jgi:hypothetical protein
MRAIPATEIIMIPDQDADMPKAECYKTVAAV